MHVSHIRLLDLHVVRCIQVDSFSLSLSHTIFSTRNVCIHIHTASRYKIDTNSIKVTSVPVCPHVDNMQIRRMHCTRKHPDLDICIFCCFLAFSWKIYPFWVSKLIASDGGQKTSMMQKRNHMYNFVYSHPSNRTIQRTLEILMLYLQVGQVEEGTSAYRNLF